MVHFPYFRGKIFFPENPAVTKTSYRFLAPCQTLERTNDATPMPRQMERWMDRQTLFNRTLPATDGGPKSADHLKCSNILRPMSICLL